MSARVMTGMDSRRGKSLLSVTHDYAFQEPTGKLYRQQKASKFTSQWSLPTTFSPPGWRPRLLWLTYKICQQNGQEKGRSDGGQGSAFPTAVFGGLLQLEGLPGERIPRQQAGWWCVNGSWGQRVSWRRAAEQGCASRGCLKEEVPAKRRGRVSLTVVA